MGVKQGPPIYQHMQDNAFQHEFKPNGDKLCNVFFDDTHAADHVIEAHIETLGHTLTVARHFCIQYRLTKGLFAQPKVLLTGFVCFVKGRTCDPKKIEQLRYWPAYKGCSCITSHLAFCHYLREFYGPDFSAKAQPLRAYSKKGADFARYVDDLEAQAARGWLCKRTLENVVLTSPDFSAAAEPWKTGRPFEAWLDVSDIAWCVCLTQRDVAGGTTRIIAMISKSFVDEATRWSAFEREFYCFKEGYHAIAEHVAGFTLFVYFDHTIRTSSTQRASLNLEERVKSSLIGLQTRRILWQLLFAFGSTVN